MRRTDPAADADPRLARLQATRRNRLLADMLEYWQDLREGEGLPARSRIDPRRIEGALPYAFILERTGPELARFRVSGGHLNDLAGMETRGMTLSSLFDPSQRPRILKLTSALFEEPEISELTLAAIDRELRAEMLLLPLLDETGRVSRALGCLVSHGKIGPAPVRFTIQRHRQTRLPRYTTPPGPNRRTPRRGFELTGLEEAQERYLAHTTAPAPAPAEGPAEGTAHVPYLRVVK